MTDHNRRDSLRPRPVPRARPGPRTDSVLLYSVGRSIPRSDRNDLEVLLNQFHANQELQDRCSTVEINARLYLTLDQAEGLGQRYTATILIPAGTLLAVYFGSLEQVRSGEEYALNHSRAQGRLDFNYELLIDGTPRRGETHPGCLQLVNHCCKPGNNAVCEEWSCPDTGLTAFFLRSERDILPGVEVKFPYQEQAGAGGGSKTQEISIRVFYYKRLYTTVSDSQIQADPSNYNSFPFWPQKLPKTFREDAIQLPLAGKWP